jgi:hypothetical protein
MYRLKTALLLPLLLLLGGCVTYPTYSYRDDGYGRSVRYVGDDSYYASSDGYYGDYYYRDYGSSYGYYAPDYARYSAYYSLFWPVQRWYHDPYWHPGFYYGVTYFPRNYFSISFYNGFHGSLGYSWSNRRYWPYYGYNHWYSPYRYSWADSYYDWDRYRYHYRDNRNGRGYYSRALNTPRYGNARNQAERLAALEPARGDGIGAALGGRNAPRSLPAARPDYAPADRRSRGADYRSRSDARAPLATQGFGVPRAQPRSSRSAAIGPQSRDYEAGSETTTRSTARRSLQTLPGTPTVERSAPVQRTQPSYRGTQRSRSFDGGPVGNESSYRSRRYASPTSESSRGASVSPTPRLESRSYSPRSYESRSRSYQSPAATAPPPARFEAASPRPQPSFERLAPERGQRDFGGSRGADFGGRSVGGERSAPAPRSEPAPAPRAERGRSHDGGRSDAREALHFDR